MFTLVSFLVLLSVSAAVQVSELTVDDIRPAFVENPVLVIFAYDTTVLDYKSRMGLFKDIVNDMEFEVPPKFLTADCSIVNRICMKYRVVTRPTVLIVRKDRTQERYTDDLNSYKFRVFLRSNLSKNASSFSSTQFRLIFLVVILIALVFLFLRTVRSSYADALKEDVEEHAPLVNH